MSGHAPELRGNAAKGANTKALVPDASQLQRRATDMCPSEYNRHMLKVAASLQAVYDLLCSGDVLWAIRSCRPCAST